MFCSFSQRSMVTPPSFLLISAFFYQSQTYVLILIVHLNAVLLITYRDNIGQVFRFAFTYSLYSSRTIKYEIMFSISPMTSGSFRRHSRSFTILPRKNRFPLMIRGYRSSTNILSSSILPLSCLPTAIFPRLLRFHVQIHVWCLTLNHCDRYRLLICIQRINDDIFPLFARNSIVR